VKDIQGKFFNGRIHKKKKSFSAMGVIKRELRGGEKIVLQECFPLSRPASAAINN
jgi:ribosomal protein S17